MERARASERFCRDKLTLINGKAMVMEFGKLLYSFCGQAFGGGSPGRIERTLSGEGERAGLGLAVLLGRPCVSGPTAFHSPHSTQRKKNSIFNEIRN